MKNIFFVLFLTLALSCAKEPQQNQTEILSIKAQYPKDQGVSKAEFDPGDAVGVYGTTDGTELQPSGNTLDNLKFIAATDKKTFAATPAVYYPDASQAMNLYSYFPHQPSVTDAYAVDFSVEKNQSQPTQLKSSDLCWGATSTTASPQAVPLTYRHVLSRLVVVVSAPTGVTVKEIQLPKVEYSGKLNVRTGTFTNQSPRSTISSSTGELIIPAQTLERIEIKMSDDNTYIYMPDRPMVLASGYSYAVGLTLRQTAGNYRAELSSDVKVSDWVSGASSAAVSEKVSNRFTAHWILPHPNYRNIDRIAIEAKNKEHLATGVNLADGHSSLTASFSFNFTVSENELSYSFPIQSIAFYQGTTLIQRCSAGSVVGLSVYKSGDYTIGLMQEHVLELTSGRIVDWTKLGSFVGGITGGVLNEFAVELIEPGSNYTSISKLKMTIDKVDYHWNSVSIASGSTVLRARVTPFSFLGEATKKTPPIYPYKIERLQFMNNSGLVLVDFSPQTSVTRPGRIELQTF